MKSNKWHYPTFCLVIATFLFVGCSRKKIANDYYIELFDEGKHVYYVVEKGVDSGGGVYDGIVKDIGWKDNELLARIRRLSSADPHGFYKLNLDTGNVTGPITDESEILSFKVVKAESFFEDPQSYKVE